MMGAEVDYQLAAPAEARTPNLHRVTIAPQMSADGRMATEAARLKGKEPMQVKTKPSWLAATFSWKDLDARLTVNVGSVKKSLQQSPLTMASGVD